MESVLQSYGPRRKKTCSDLANNREANQPAHLHSLISAFIICILESISSRLAISKISIFYLVSVAEQAGLNLGNQEDRFLSRRGPYYNLLTTLHGFLYFRKVKQY